jgi:hypothetical protein
MDSRLICTEFSLDLALVLSPCLSLSLEVSFTLKLSDKKKMPNIIKAFLLLTAKSWSVCYCQAFQGR